MTVFSNVNRETLNSLTKKGFLKEEPKNIYEEFRLKKAEVTLIVYNSGKLLLQGKKESVENITKELQKLEIGEMIESEHFKKEVGSVIGSDESLKGDTFGGLVVAAVKADPKTRQQLQQLGVADSKTLSDNEIILMAEKIKHLAPCEIRSLLPVEYNQHGKVTLMLNDLHRECALFLAPGKHVVDKYPGCIVGDVREEKAESKYVEVAAASVLARAAALQQLDYLSAQAGFPLPKGSTHVQGALKRLKERKFDFRQFVKVDFRNVRDFL